MSLLSLLLSDLPSAFLFVCPKSSFLSKEKCLTGDYLIYRYDLFAPRVTFPSRFSCFWFASRHLNIICLWSSESIVVVPTGSKRPTASQLNLSGYPYRHYCPSDDNSAELPQEIPPVIIPLLRNGCLQHKPTLFIKKEQQSVSGEPLQIQHNNAVLEYNHLI